MKLIKLSFENKNLNLAYLLYMFFRKKNFLFEQEILFLYTYVRLLPHNCARRSTYKYLQFEDKKISITSVIDFRNLNVIIKKERRLKSKERNIPMVENGNLLKIVIIIMILKRRGQSFHFI